MTTNNVQKILEFVFALMYDRGLDQGWFLTLDVKNPSQVAVLRKRDGSSRSVSFGYDPNEVGSELVVTCLISLSPRAGDSTFDPQPSDMLLVTDVDGEDLWARVVRRDGNQVSVQLIVPELHTAPSGASV